MNGLPICLVDTNLLVYAVDARDGVKQQRAIATLDHVHGRRVGALSPQILGEFFTAATRRLPAPLTQPEAERLLAAYVASWRMYELTAATVLRAVRGVRMYQLS